MAKSDYRDMWVYLELEDGALSPVSLELCCEARRLCSESAERLIGDSAQPLPEAELERVRDCGADGVIMAGGAGRERYNTEAYTALFTELCRKYRPSAVFVGATVNGRDFAPRFAARLGTGCTSDATELIYNPGTRDIEFVEPAAGGKIMAVITIPELRPQVGTIRPGTFKYAPGGRREAFEVIEEDMPFPAEEIRTKLLGFRPNEFDAELDIGGRPLGVASIHLENRTHGEGRRIQLETVLRAAEELLPGMPLVLGGDLNTNTFDGRDKDAIGEIAGSPALQRRCLEEVAQYEAALPAAEAMGYRAVPEKPILTRRKPLPEGGSLGLRLDWLLLRGMEPADSRTISTRTADCTFARPDSALARFTGEELSDHNAVWAACRMQ